MTFEKIVRIVSEGNTLSKKTINAMPELFKLTFTLLITFLVDLSDEGPLDWYRKNNITALFEPPFHYNLYLYIP